MIGVFGAGSVGCWLGGCLAAAGAEVTLVGRPRLMAELAELGLRVTDLAGLDRTVRVATATEPGAIAGAALVLVTVKSADTAAAGAALAGVLADSAVVASLQNGVRNTDVLRAALPGRTVLAGMVPWNVTRPGPGAFHRASSGTVMIERSPAAAPLVRAAVAARLPIEERADMPAVAWAKLVLNLNNAVNALSDLPLAAELAERAYRRCLAAAQREALAILAAAAQPIARLTAIPPAWMPRLLTLPDPVFRRVARRVVAIDPLARSSMWDDLAAGRPTEVDYIQGEVVALAERLGRDAPVNRALARLVHAAETGGRRGYRGDELRRALGV